MLADLFYSTHPDSQLVQPGVPSNSGASEPCLFRY
jgi:hypothetical protein